MKNYICIPLLRICPLFIFLAFFFGCNHRNGQDVNQLFDGNAEAIVINNDKITNVRFQDFIENVSYLALETIKESMISSVDKLILGDSVILIWDNKIHEVFLFNRKGKFLNKIDRRGKGPEEYVSVTDVILDEKKNEVLLLDPGKQSIFYFNLNGNFEQSIRIPDFDKSGISFTLFNDRWVFNRSLYRLDDNYLAVFKPETAKFEKSFIPNSLKSIQGGYDFINNLSLFKDKLYYLAPLSNRIYMINKDFTYKEQFAIDFKESNPDYDRLSRMNFSSIKNFQEFIDQHNYSIFLENLLVTDKYIHFTTSNNNGFHTLIYNRGEKNAKVFSSVLGDLDRHVWSPIRAVTKQGEFVSAIDNPEYIFNLVVTQKLGELSDLQSNPVLAFYSLKDDYFKN